MRRIAVLLVPLLVVVFQAAVYAADHWDRVAGTAAPVPDPAQSATGAVMVGVTVAVLAWLIFRLLGAGLRCSFFVALGSVGTMIVAGEYGLIFTSGHILSQGRADRGLITVLNIIVLTVMLVWAAPCCLNKRVTWVDALKVTIIPALVPVVYGVLKHGIR